MNGPSLSILVTDDDGVRSPLRPVQKSRFKLSAERRRWALWQIRRRVDRSLVDPQLEVKMRAGRVSRRSLEPDWRALGDHLADLDQRGREVPVQSVESP